MTQIGNTTGCREYCPSDAFNFKQSISQNQIKMPCVKCQCKSSCISCNWQCDQCLNCINQYSIFINDNNGTVLVDNNGN